VGADGERRTKMWRWKWGSGAAVALLLGVSPPAHAQTSEADRALERFWRADPEERDARADEVLAAGLPFDSLHARLAGGRQYSKRVPKGRREKVRENTDGMPFRYFFVVPESYDPARRYPVRFFLHGNVNRAAPEKGGEWWPEWERVASDDYIAVFPSSWTAARWWQARQVDNLRAILATLKETYNEDENRVVLVGVSDGGTGAWFYGFRDITPWASFLPLIGHPVVLLDPLARADGTMFADDLANRSFFVVSGTTDRLYPTSEVVPWIEALQAASVDVVFRSHASGHDVTWWPEEAANIDAFIAARPRDPHPDRVVWVTERTDRYNRAHWIVIDELVEGGAGPEGDEARSPRGRVIASRTDNTIVLETEGVAKLTLLLSPSEIDFSRPVRVDADGGVVFDGVLEPDPTTLVRWAAVDDDRTMLYGAELELDLHRYAEGPAKDPGVGRE
jgi:predicted esterase